MQTKMPHHHGQSAIEHYKCECKNQENLTFDLLPLTY